MSEPLLYTVISPGNIVIGHELDTVKYNRAQLDDAFKLLARSERDLRAIERANRAACEHPPSVREPSKISPDEMSCIACGIECVP